MVEAAREPWARGAMIPGGAAGTASPPHLMGSLSLSPLLPLLPPLAVFLAGRAPLYTSYGAPKALACACLLLFLALLRPRAPARGANLAPWMACLFLCAQSHLTGFTHLSLLFGLVSLVALARARAAAHRPDRWSAAALCLLPAIALAPFAEHELAARLRGAALPAVDALLSAAGIPFERSGTSYLLPGFAARVEERCSGYSTSRLLAALLAGWLLLRRRPRAALLFSLPAGVAAGFLANALRIALHLALSHAAGRALPAAWHEALGVLCALAAGAGALIALDRFPSLEIRGRADAPPAALPRPCGPAAPPPGLPRHRLYAPAVALAFAACLLALPGRLSKRIEHAHVAHPNLAFETVHRNTFREWPGGGSWILFENPIDRCFAYAGFTGSGEEGRFARGDERVTARTTWFVDGRARETRWLAIFEKWIRVDRHDAPVEAVIEVTRRGD